MTKYVAKQSIGELRPNDEVKGLSDERIQALLASGAIEEYQEPKSVESESDKLKKAKSDIKDLQAQVAELTKENEALKAQLAQNPDPSNQNPPQ